MTSDANKMKITKYADENDTDKDTKWIDEMERQADVEAKSISSIYVADNLESEGHKVPTVDMVYNVNDKGVEKFSVELFDAWARDSSGERFVSRNQGKDPYIYKDGVYIPQVTGWMNAVMKACNQNEGVSDHFTKETVSRIAKNCEMRAEALTGQDPNITVIGNCALNTLTGEVQDYDPEHIAFSKLQVNYDKDAQCPVWDEFLSYTLPADEIESLQELFGYCLVAGYPYHAAWFLLGRGQNGKGVAMNILRAMLGKRNCSAVALQEVNERFYSHDLHNKYANISGDTSPRALCDASMYKMLTGGDEIRVEQKGKDAFDFVNHAKIISSMNELMKSDDQSDGFFRRFVLIRFAKNITEERRREKDGFDKEIINNEMSGVLNWAIEGLKRVRAQGGFTFQLGKTKADLRGIWNAEADPLYEFFNTCCDSGPEYLIPTKVFTHFYNAWHEEKYGTPVKEKKGEITSRLEKFGVYRDSKKATGEFIEIWGGLTEKGNYPSVPIYKGARLKNTSGDLSVDINHVSMYWNEITGCE